MRFEVLQPERLDEALSLLHTHREEARVIAGGQSLLLMIRAGLVRSRLLLSLSSLNGLTEIKETSGGTLCVGALATHRDIMCSQVVRQKACILTQAVQQIGSTPVRNFGTIGGNLCHNEMGGDPPPALLVLGAKAECISVRGKREISLGDFFQGYFETCLEPDELMQGLKIPPAPAGSRAVYLKHRIRSGDLAIVGVAVMLRAKDGHCDDVRIALGGVAPVPFRVLEAEKLIRGQELNDRVIEDVAQAAAESSDPLSDAHASAGYRKKMVRVFVKRAIWRAINGGQENER